MKIQITFQYTQLEKQMKKRIRKEAELIVSFSWKKRQLLFSSTELKAHRRAYRIPMLRRPSVLRPFTISNIFSSETACPIKAKFYMEPPWVGGMKVYSGHLCHMTKMAATPIHGKNPIKIFFYGPISTKIGMQNRGLLSIIVCSNDDPGVTLTYFMARSNFQTGFS